MIDQLEFPVGVQNARVRPDGIDRHTVERLRGGQEGVGQFARIDIDHEIVDRVVRTAFHDIEREDVRSDRTESQGERAEATGTIG